jgi:hypothetical protein
MLSPVWQVLVSFPEISLLLSHIISRFLLQMPLDLRKSLNVLRNHSYDLGATTCPMESRGDYNVLIDICTGAPDAIPA